MYHSTLPRPWSISGCLFCHYMRKWYWDFQLQLWVCLLLLAEVSVFASCILKFYYQRQNCIGLLHLLMHLPIHHYQTFLTSDWSLLWNLLEGQVWWQSLHAAFGVHMWGEPPQNAGPRVQEGCGPETQNWIKMVLLQLLKQDQYQQCPSKTKYKAWINSRPQGSHTV